jgi:hypothetical protein
MELLTETVPAKKSGRKPKEVDADFLKVLADALKKAKPIKVDGVDRPNSFGPNTDYDTEGKATADARRYVKALTEGDNAPMKGATVKVRSIEGDKDDTVPDGKFRWKVYIPLPK